ncbi:hypothetical protein QVD17_38691 [Tagetes erecta]|uniref:Uncharacterized protein n=1 Tax=Tagetes erecta TaxID=13708 RepID=A0AAD8JSK7_TARER|nr:hypothetical protein QVD17_38691 [Tagetes erecta]
MIPRRIVDVGCVLISTKFSKHASSSTNNWRTTLSIDEIKLGDTPFVKYYKGDEYVECENLEERSSRRAMVALRISVAKVASIASVLDATCVGFRTVDVGCVLISMQMHL